MVKENTPVSYLYGAGVMCYNAYKRAWEYDYISAIMILSQCDGIMACRTCGAVAAYLFGEEFQDVYFWNLRRYVTDEYPKIV